MANRTCGVAAQAVGAGVGAVVGAKVRGDVKAAALGGLGAVLATIFSYEACMLDFAGALVGESGPLGDYPDPTGNPMA